jgi:hypothetical protein
MDVELEKPQNNHRNCGFSNFVPTAPSPASTFRWGRRRPTSASPPNKPNQRWQADFTHWWITGAPRHRTRRRGHVSQRVCRSQHFSFHTDRHGVHHPTRSRQVRTIPTICQETAAPPTRRHLDRRTANPTQRLHPVNTTVADHTDPCPTAPLPRPPTGATPNSPGTRVDTHDRVLILTRDVNIRIFNAATGEVLRELPSTAPGTTIPPKPQRSHTENRGPKEGPRLFRCPATSHRSGGYDLNLRLLYSRSHRDSIQLVCK